MPRRPAPRRRRRSRPTRPARAPRSATAKTASFEVLLVVPEAVDEALARARAGAVVGAARVLGRKRGLHRVPVEALALLPRELDLEDRVRVLLDGVLPVLVDAARRVELEEEQVHVVVLLELVEERLRAARS